jgi:hypothetical protein
MSGIEPKAFRMRNGRSTTELHPPWHKRGACTVLYVIFWRGVKRYVRRVDYLFFNVCLCEGENALKSQKRRVYGDVVIKSNLIKGWAEMCVGRLKLYCF